MYYLVHVIVLWYTWFQRRPEQMPRALLCSCAKCHTGALLDLLLCVCRDYDTSTTGILADINVCNTQEVGFRHTFRTAAGTLRDSKARQRLLGLFNA